MLFSFFLVLMQVGSREGGNSSIHTVRNGWVTSTTRRPSPQLRASNTVMNVNYCIETLHDGVVNNSITAFHHYDDAFEN